MISIVLIALRILCPDSTQAQIKCLLLKFGFTITTIEKENLEDWRLEDGKSYKDYLEEITEAVKKKAGNGIQRNRKRVSGTGNDESEKGERLL